MPGARIFLIDDDPTICDDLSLILQGRFNVQVAADGPSALARLEEVAPDVVLLDVDFGAGRMTGLEVLEKIRTLDDPPPVIMLSGSQDLEVVVQAIKMGAFHYAAKPADLPQLLNLMDKALRTRLTDRAIRAHRDEVGRLTGAFVAGDDQTYKLLQQVELVAATDATVLITGESGTGKEMVARRIHEQSPFAKGPFVGVNCGAVPETMIESEIFGHAKGAFTGADSLRIGKVELAAGGSLFLDEIGDGPQAFQVKLLRVLGEHVFQRLGENSDLEVQTRIMAATSKDLEQAMTRGEFRPELFYRLNIYRIHLSPLKERPGDILPLARTFLTAAASRFRRDIHGFSPVVEKWLLEHPWPGNVRQLSNEVERAVIRCQGQIIGAGHMFAGDTGAAQSNETYNEAKERVTRAWQTKFVAARLQDTGGNVSEAAERSGMPRQSFQRLLRELGLDPEDFKN